MLYQLSYSRSYQPRSQPNAAHRGMSRILRISRAASPKIFTHPDRMLFLIHFAQTTGNRADKTNARIGALRARRDPRAKPCKP
ncbi:hypothetical protein O0544_22665 [Edwardsiella anguillarum]|nr:hypothetical protein [Edwardsiella anguillarum]